MSVIPAPASPSSALALQALGKHFGNQQVLSDISLEVRPGEIFGLIGLNGAGKTTLIKLVLDLMRADAGSARIFNVAATRVEARRALAYLPEKFQPPRFTRGMEFLTLALGPYGMKLSHAEAKELAAALDLDPAALARQVKHYSKGMVQKLGLMYVFLSRRPLLILDEPMSGLDPLARTRFISQVLRTREQGATVFLSSHILADMELICDRIAVLHASCLQFVGPPQQLKQHTARLDLNAAFLALIEDSARLKRGESVL